MLQMQIHVNGMSAVYISNAMFIYVCVVLCCVASLILISLNLKYAEYSSKRKRDKLNKQWHADSSSNVVVEGKHKDVP